MRVLIKTVERNMEIMNIDILVLVLFVVLIYNIKPVKSLSSFNDNYLSLESCNMLRGFFAVTVVFHHLSQIFKTGIIFPLFRNFGTISVAVFFFFSGYGLMKKYITDENYKKGFLLRRLTVIVIPYIIITAIYWAYNIIIGNRYSLTDIFIAIWNGSPIAINSWYIINIIIFYTVYYFMMLICRKKYFAIIGLSSIYCVIWIIFCRRMGYIGVWYITTPVIVVGLIWALMEEYIIKSIKKYYRIIAPILWGGY